MEFLLRSNMIRFTSKIVYESSGKEQEDILKELKRQFFVFENPDDDIFNSRYKVGRMKKVASGKKSGCDDLLISFMSGFYLSSRNPIKK